eukprot:100574-Pelagomonas_calceolata.AAC.1
MWKLAKKGTKSAFGRWAKVCYGLKRSLNRSLHFLHSLHTVAPQSNYNGREHVSRPGLRYTHTYHEHFNHPAIYRTRPSSSGHEA